ncbi:vacuolar protein sorting-associated protein vps13 [Umbelopsis sp. AD052]|nr:vacuolar protein sorting-associated protein vps13 [Umbelopsis sp. AD052]
MLESLVTTLLNRFLGAYVSNLNYNQLKIGIWSGDVVLRDLQLKREALDKFDLPVDVLEGHLGELTLSIPWSNLKNKPVKVYINNVYLLAVPRNESSMTEEERNRRRQQLKKDKLANAELLSEPTKSAPSSTVDSQEEAKNDTFINQLTTKIIDNLQFSMKNIHIRYEDEGADQLQPFAAGITLGELSAISTNGQWVPTFISEATNTIHKLATLESLSVYWNTNSKSLAGKEDAMAAFSELITTKYNVPSEHQYILKPVSGTGRININKRFGGEVPNLDATLLFDELGFVLDDEQYRDILAMIDAFHATLKRQQYHQFRPPKEHTPKSHPKEWFQYAAMAVKSEIHETHYRWSWEHFKERRDDRIHYLDCYVANELGRATPNQVIQLNALEDKLSYEDIRFYRSIAKNRLRRERAVIAVEEKRKKEAAAKRPNQGAWISNWWYGNPGTQTDEADEELQMTDEQRQELYNAIEYDEDKAAVTTAVDFPVETMKLSLKTTLNKGSFMLKRHPHNEKPTVLGSLVFDMVTTNFVQYMEGFKVTAALGDVRLYDDVTEGTLYRQLIGVKDKPTGDDDDSSPVNAISKWQSSRSQPFFSVAFEHNPLDRRADNGLSLKMHHIEIIYNPSIVREVITFFTPPESRMDSINALIEVAGDTLEGIRKQTRAGLEFAVEQHTTLDLRVDMDAPIIAIPEDCTRSNAQVIVLDAGHINVESQLAPPDALNALKSKAKEDYNAEDDIQLQSLMYDKFSVQLTQTKALIGYSVEACLEQIQDPKPENDYLHFVERIDMSFMVEMCILPKTTEMTRFRVSGHLPLLSVNFSDRKYRTLMTIIDLVVPRDEQQDSAGTTSPNQSNDFATDDEDTVQKHGSRNNVIAKLWGQNEVLVDTDSDRGDSDDEDNVSISPSTVTTDTEYTDHDLVQGKPRSQKQPPRINLQQKLFEFDFKVDKVSASVSEVSKNSSKQEELLCDLVFQHFQLHFALHPYHMDVDVALKSLNVMDRMPHGHEFKYLVTSEKIDEAGKATEDTKNLVNVHYVRINPQSPELQQKYKGIGQTADVTLSTLNLIVTQSSVLRLYNFVLTTFTSGPNGQQSAMPLPASTQTGKPRSASNAGHFGRRLSSFGEADAEANLMTSANKNQLQQNSNIKVDLKLESVNLILNNNGTRLATGALSHGTMDILLFNEKLQVKAKFGNFILTNDRHERLPHHLRKTSKTLLSMEGDELADFSFETFSPKEPHYPGYDQLLYFRMGSAHMNFLEEPVQQVLHFLSTFAEMKSVYDRARQAAIESAQQLQQAVTKLHFDFLIKSPIIEFPGATPKSASSIITARLGEISATNSFKDDHSKQGYLNMIKAQIRSISLSSKPASQLVDVDTNGKNQLSIINDIDLTFDIEYSDGSLAAERPDIKILGGITDVRMNLTPQQLACLLETINAVSRSLSSPGDDGSNPEPTNTQDTRSSDKQIEAPEDDSTQQADDASITRLQMSMIMKQTYLELFSKDSDGTEEDLSTMSLAKFALNDSELTLNMARDTSMKVDFAVQSLTLSDTRPDVKSRFKEIMRANIQKDPQFSVHIDVSKPYPQRHGIVIVELQSPKIILSLDHVFSLRDFITIPFGTESDAQKYAQQVNTPESHPSQRRKSVSVQNEQPQGMELSYRINITDTEAILLANPTSPSSEAVILSAQQIMFSQQSIMAIVGKQVGMFLCRMDKRKETTLSFIDTFDMSMSRDDKSSTPDHTILSFIVDVDALVLRLSYRDAMLILEIVNKALELLNRGGQGSQGTLAANNDENADDSDVAKMAKRKSLTSTAATLANTPQNLRLASSPNAAPVVASEMLKATFQGMRLVLIEDIHELPLIDMNLEQFSIKASDWSKSLLVDVDFQSYANFFNVKNSHWEPLIEPWKFNMKLMRRSNLDPYALQISSRRMLEINFTHTFAETVLSTLSTWDKEKGTALGPARGSVAPYTLRNWTGYQLHVWSINDDDNSQTVVEMIANGQEIPWRFDDWRARRQASYKGNNMLGLQMQGGPLWESLKNISVDHEGEHMYVLRPKIDDVAHRLVVDIKLVDNVKVVTLRSAMVVENRTLLPVDVVMVDNKGNMASDIHKIAPGDDYALPIEASYHHSLRVRPDAGFGYSWSRQQIFWADITQNRCPRSLACYPGERGPPPFRFQVHGRYDKKNPLSKYYPCSKIRLSAPVEIENLLPYDFNFRIVDKDTGQDFSSFLRKSGTSPLHVVEMGHLLLMNIHMQESAYKPSEFAIISTHDNDDLNIDEKFTLLDNDNVPLTLRINSIEIPESGGAHKFSIYCPYIMLNKTGRDIVYKGKPFMQGARFTAGQNAMRNRGRKAEPFMFSYPKIDNRNRCLIQVADSGWSQPISLEAVGSVQDVALPSINRVEEFHVGVSVQEGQGKFKLIKLITFTPRYILRNDTSHDIKYREPGSRADSLLTSNSSLPLYFVRQNAEKQLSIKFPGVGHAWSSPFSIQDIGKVHVRLDTEDGSPPTLIKASMIMEDATIFVIFKEEKGKWPYLLVNETAEDVLFYQEDPSMQDEYGNNLQPRGLKKYYLKSGESLRYSWDMPAVKDKQLILSVHGRERRINIQEIGDQIPFRHRTRDGGWDIMSLDIIAQGSTQILRLSTYNQSQSIYRPQTSSSSASVASSAREGFETVDVEHIVNFIFNIKLAGIGVSIVNKHMQEIAYATARDLDVKITDSNMYTSLRTNIKWLQIDNQLFGSIYPILLYPSALPKDTEDRIMVPTFQLGLDKVKDDTHGVSFFKYFSVLLQEMTFEMDEDFLYAIIDFTQFDVAGWNAAETNVQLCDDNLDIPEPKTTDDVAQLYFEVFNIQPVKLNLSFVRTQGANIVDERPTGDSALMFLINVLTMALGNINEAPIRFNALAAENMRVNDTDLVNRVTMHYREQFIYQIHKVLGSADFLGNPVGLFNTLSSGVAELFYEPYQGMIMNDGPQELGIGIARGVSGFVKKSVFGFSDSFTKFTGSIGKGLSVATMDRAYQDRRRINMTRNRPKHALYGVTAGANSFANSFASGVAGLVKRPIEGVEKDGVGGFFTGVGKGLVGVVTKPMVGVFDLASNVTEGIRNTTAGDTLIDRVRAPRHVGADGILTQYSTREAQGQLWQKMVEGGQYSNENYIAHCEVQDTEVVAILTDASIMLVKTRRLTVDWREPFTEIQTIKCEPTGVAIYLRSRAWEPFIIISDRRSREQFFNQIESTVVRWSRKVRPEY